MIKLSAVYPGAWLIAGIGVLAFLLAVLLGQVGFMRLVTNRWKKRALARGLHEDQTRKTYLYARLIPIGSLTAGVLEETARFALLSLMLPYAAAPWIIGVAFGLGHGGIESIVLGLASGVVGLLDFLLPAKMAGLTLTGVRRYRASEHWIGIGERAGVTLCHVLFTLLVVRTVLTGNILWYFTAMALHATMDFVWGSGRLRYGWSLFRCMLVPWVTALAGLLLLWVSGGLLT
ncbi:YhfC family intramembrane metalloprotease [Candidatus Acetothermia bacterium]|nr:YhfC family intramembrane metalloprotease [Candidatus Acetothermia bacterium]